MSKTALALGAFGLLVLVGGFYLHAASAPSAASTASASSTVSAGDTSGSASSSPAVSGSTYTLAQVAEHAGAASCYTAINGSVYDLTTWINQHPGGPDAILSICGKDGTAAFEGQHGDNARANAVLATFKIGTLAP